MALAMGGPATAGPVVTIQTGQNVRHDGHLPADQLESLVKAASETVDVFRVAVSR
jgi:hypothetical protein